MRTIRSVFVGLALSLVAVPAFADGHIKIDGIKGESVEHDHAGEIHIGSVTVKNHAFHFVKKTDSDSSKLAALAGKKEALPGTVVVVLDSPRKPKKDQQEFIKVEMKEVLVSSYQSDGRAPGLETFDLAARSSEVFTRDGSGPWVKHDSALLTRDFPSIFLP